VAVQRHQSGIDGEEDRRTVMEIDEPREVFDGLVESAQLREDHAVAVLNDRRQRGGRALQL
jgi:hypothetical protein